MKGDKKMKKKLKKLLAVAFTMLICSSQFIVNANAVENELTVGECTESDCTESDCTSKGSKAIIYCDSSPSYKHEAYSRGLGILYRRNSDGTRTLIYNNGCTWQCKYCNTVVVTKGEAARGQAIGYYATWNPGKPTSIWGTELTSANIWYTSSSKLEGYNFYYN